MERESSYPSRARHSCVRAAYGTAFLPVAQSRCRGRRLVGYSHRRKQRGIRVNCIAPRPVITPMIRGPDMSDEARERLRNLSVLKVEGSGWDVGNAVCFLASARARYITGQVLVVDGGVTLGR